MHHAKRMRVIGEGNRGQVGKAAVFGLLERTSPEKHSTVRVFAVKDTRRGTLQAKVRENVEAGSNLYTDALLSYKGWKRTSFVA
jgi:hypothetical protein